jgi:hypothetical protein
LYHHDILKSIRSGTLRGKEIVRLVKADRFRRLWQVQPDLGRNDYQSGGIFPKPLIALSVIGFSLIAPKASADRFSWLRSSAVSQFNWLLMSIGNLLLLFCIAVAASPMGKIRLGGKGATAHRFLISA